MIDTTKYEGHTFDWKELHWHCTKAITSPHGWHPLRIQDGQLLKDAPIILEALKAAQARIAELEAKLKPREYTDDELTAMAR